MKHVAATTSAKKVLDCVLWYVARHLTAPCHLGVVATEFASSAEVLDELLHLCVVLADSTSSAEELVSVVVSPLPFRLTRLVCPICSLVYVGSYCRESGAIL